MRSNAVGSDSTSSVDRKGLQILGYVVAQKGRFKSEGRGQFTEESLQEIVTLGNASPNGVRVRFGHPNQSNDGLGKYLGRAKNFRLEDGSKVRADMQLNPTSMEQPPAGGRPLGEYVMHLAETDPEAFSTSLAMLAEKEDIEGQPPVWHPEKLFASDVVDTGDAVDGFLSTDLLDDLPSGDVYIATKLIDEKFSGQSREVVSARLSAFVVKYLDHKFGEVEEEEESSEDDDMSTDNDRLQVLEEQARETNKQVTATLGALKSLTEQLAADRKSNQELAASEKRAADITALCAQCGVDSAKATEWISDEKLSLGDVKDKLLMLKFEDSKPAGGGKEDKDTSEAKYLKEFELNADVHQKMGVTRKDYVELRKAEDGIKDKDAEYEPEYMSPEWAEKYRKQIEGQAD